MAVNNTSQPMRHIDVAALTADEIDQVEKVSLRLVYQAAAQFADEAWEIFCSSPDKEKDIAEDVTREMLDSFSGYTIRQRMFGTVDYKRPRWLPMPFGLVPQVLLVDAKAEDEDTRARLQLTQISMKVSFRSRTGELIEHDPGLEEYVAIRTLGGETKAITSMILAHYCYHSVQGKKRRLVNLRLIALPHGRLKERYCPSADDNIWIEGPHSKKLEEEARCRLSFKKMREKCPWRMQIIRWDTRGKATLAWTDVDERNTLVSVPVVIDRATQT